MIRAFAGCYGWLGGGLLGRVALQRTPGSSWGGGMRGIPFTGEFSVRENIGQGCEKTIFYSLQAAYTD